MIGIVNPIPLFLSLFSQSYCLIFFQKVFALVIIQLRKFLIIHAHAKYIAIDAIFVYAPTPVHVWITSFMLLLCKHIHLVNIFTSLDREQENETECSGKNSSTNTTTSAAMLSDSNESTRIEHIKSGSASTILSACVTLESSSSVDVSSLQYLNTR